MEIPYTRIIQATKNEGIQQIIDIYISEDNIDQRENKHYYSAQLVSLFFYS